MQLVSIASCIVTIISKNTFFSYIHAERLKIISHLLNDEEQFAIKRDVTFVTFIYLCLSPRAASGFFAAFIRIDETIKTVERCAEFIKVKRLFQQSC